MASGGVHKLSPVCALVSERTGSSLSGHQVARLQEALASRLGGRTEEDYARHLRSREGVADLVSLMAAISVHKTDLFRDPVQLDAFVEHVLAPLAATGRPLQLWSAGCATGEEVATLLILLREVGAHPESSVLGTDISEAALAQARRFSFHPDLLKRVPGELRARCFRLVRGRYELLRELQGAASFRVHNLMDLPYPAPAHRADGFDVVFCRNVLIYFTEAAFDFTVAALGRSLVKNGTLVLSSAEPILRPQPGLQPLRCDRAFFYVRADGPGVGLRRVSGVTTPAPTSTVLRGSPPPREAIARPRIEPTSTGKAAPSPGGGRTAATTASTATAAPGSRSPLRRLTPPSMRMVTPPGTPREDDPLAQASEIFARVIDDAAQGEDEAITEKGLRACLYLDPHFAQARYLLGIILEHRGDLLGAAGEFRRALQALKEGRSRQTPFFLNDERLQAACASAIRRLESHSLASR